jgi:N-acetyl-anhydromuramyl-L-alanine amidase AmpD
MRTINLLVIHCTATRNGEFIPLETIRAWHLARGFKDIGYHYVITPDGALLTGRPEEIPGAHAKGFNAHSLGIALEGGLLGHWKNNEGRYTLAAWRTLKLWIETEQLRFPSAEVKGHRELSPDLDHDGIVEPSEWVKTCPAFDVPTWIKANHVPDFRNVFDQPFMPRLGGIL